MDISIDVGDNLQSETPFKHRRFKCPAKGRGPPGNLNLTVMILSNERDFNCSEECVPIGKMNLTKGESQAVKNLRQNTEITRTRMLW